MPKIIQKFKGMKKSFFKSILKSDPIELAYFYVRGATENERAFIDEALNISSAEYREKVQHYIKNSDLFDTDAYLKKRFSEPSRLEEKAR